MNRWVGVLFCVVVWVIACASVPHAAGVTMAPQALAIADSVYARADARQVEDGLCIASGGYSWGWTQDGRLWAHIERFALYGRQSAQFDQADSMHLWWKGSICGDSLPSYHTHLAMSIPGPSPCDLQSLSVRPRVPFGLIQFAPGSVLVYWIPPGQHYVLARDTVHYCSPRR